MSNRKNRLIPFSWTPASWGLRGPAREEAEAAYYYEGYDLDREIASIRNRDDAEALAMALAKVDHKHGTLTDYDLALFKINADPVLLKDPIAREKAILEAKFDHEVIDAYECDREWAKLDYPEGLERNLALLAIDLRHNMMSAYDHDVAAVLFENPEAGIERAVALLEVEHKHGNLDENAFLKERATLMEEPWIGIIDHGFDPKKGLDGVYFEFDWNDYWIVFLRLHGYVGTTDEQVVDQWFSDVCRSQGMAAQLPPGYDDGTVIPFSGRVVNRVTDE